MQSYIRSHLTSWTQPAQQGRSILTHKARQKTCTNQIGQTTAFIATNNVSFSMATQTKPMYLDTYHGSAACWFLPLKLQSLEWRGTSPDRHLARSVRAGVCSYGCLSPAVLKYCDLHSSRVQNAEFGGIKRPLYLIKCPRTPAGRSPKSCSLAVSDHLIKKYSR